MSELSAKLRGRTRASTGRITGRSEVESSTRSAGRSLAGSTPIQPREIASTRNRAMPTSVHRRSKGSFSNVMASMASVVKARKKFIGKKYLAQ